jgi:hypothetical protein
MVLSFTATTWTILGVLLTAFFTGAVAVFAVLGYRLGLNEARASKRTLYKFAMVDLVQHWAVSEEWARVQVRLIFENKHPSDPIRYEIESSSLESILTGTQELAGDEIDGGSGVGVVPPGEREAYTLKPIPPEGTPGFPLAAAPRHLVIQFTVKYGAVRHHRDFEFEWREQRFLGAVLNHPPSGIAGLSSIPYTWSKPSDVERLTRRSLWERVTRKP